MFVANEEMPYLKKVKYALHIITFVMLSTLKLSAQNFQDIMLKFDVGMSMKSSNLQLTDLNEQLVSAGFLPLDYYTVEVDLFVNVKPDIYPIGISIGSSKGGSKNISLDKNSYSNLRVSYLSIGVFHEFSFKRISTRGYVMYEKANHTGEFFIRNTAGSPPLTNLTGNIITNNSQGVKPNVQLLVDVGKRRRNSIGVGWSYFFRLKQTGWKFYPTGLFNNFPELKSGEQAFSLTYLHRFYNADGNH